MEKRLSFTSSPTYGLPFAWYKGTMSSPPSNPAFRTTFKYCTFVCLSIKTSVYLSSFIA